MGKSINFVNIYHDSAGVQSIPMGPVDMSTEAQVKLRTAMTLCRIHLTTKTGNTFLSRPNSIRTFRLQTSLSDITITMLSWSSNWLLLFKPR